jgi:Gas vesicle synthesis protein GvpL/GvpF
VPEPLGLWAYGVVRGDAPEPAARCGVDGRHETELIRHAGLAAIVSAVELDEFDRGVLEQNLEELEYLETLARAHERVLEEALRLGPIVPLPICTIYEDADHVREMLEREHSALAAALERLRGTAEWGVKAYVVQGEAAPAAEPAQGPSSGIEYLARKRQEREAALTASDEAAEAVERIHEALCAHAVAAVVNAPQDQRLSGVEEEMVLNAAYLVPEARLPQFRAQIEDLASRHASEGLALALTGPWPPYHFATSAAER